MQALVTILLLVEVGIVLATILLALPGLLRKLVARSRADIVVMLSTALIFFGTGVWNVPTATLGLPEVARDQASQIVPMAIAGSALALLLLFRGRSLPWRSSFGAVLVYAGVCLLSSLFSSAPLLSLYKAVLVVLGGMLLAAAIAQVRDETSGGKVVYDTLYGALIVSVMGAAVGVYRDPEQALRPVGGVFGFQLYGTFPFANANEMGYLCAVCGFMAIANLRSRPTGAPVLLHTSVAALAITALVLCQARTSLIGFGAAVACAMLYRKNLPQKLAVCMAALIVGALLLVAESQTGALEVASAYLERGVSDEQLMSLTGRTELWKAGWRMFEDAPVIGHGFETGVRLDGAPYGIAPGSHMHNSHMQVLVNTGLLGYVAWIGMLATVGYRAAGKLKQLARRGRLAEHQFGVLLILLALIAFIRTFTGSVMLANSYSFLVLIAVAAWFESQALDRGVRPGIRQPNTRAYPNIIR